MEDFPPKRRVKPLAWSHHNTKIESTVHDLTTAEINVVFQPIVSLADGSTFAWESLVRCTRAGLESPSELFRRAEVEQSCGRLGRLIREVAFQRGVGRRLFINVHPAELAARWLVQPDDPMNFHDAEVFMEITESATFEHFELCWNALREVRERSAVRFVIDDFGAGHSNLKRVLDLEPAVVKLDCSLIQGIDQSPRQFTLVRSLVRMFGDLGASVVAEGIETFAELKRVRDAGVHYAQGYFLARPAWPLPAVQWPFR